MGRGSQISEGKDFPDRFWLREADAWLTALHTGMQGLSSAEAAARLTRYGANAAAPSRRLRFWTRILRRLFQPLIGILLIAAAVSGATGDLASLFIIAIIVLVSIGLEAFQEHRAEQEVEALQRSIALHATVLRDGRAVELPTEAIVPGDVVELEPGDLVPADGVVIESKGATANEALLTGEPYPVEKRAGPCDADDPADAFNALFGGTAIVSGRATMLAVATGARTRFGGIAAALNAEEPPTAFERGLRSLGLLILRLTIFLVLFVLLVQLVFHRPPLESFMFAVALAVGLTPELLPMVTTVTLSRGAVRMAKRRVIVKRLAAIHDLGAMDVLCTDKTGTLTKARIALAGHPGLDGRDSEQVLELAAVNSRFAGSPDNPLDKAILQHNGKADGWASIAELPFDFERRRASVLAGRGEERLLIVKGAPEEIVALCTSADQGEGAPVSCTPELRAKLDALIADRAAQGLRMLAVAYRAIPPGQTVVTPADEHDLALAGFCTFADPAKASAGPAIERLRALGVEVKILSGDAAPVVQHLVRTLGLPNDAVLTGADITKLDDQALAARAENIALFARVAPDQKTRIIRALQARGRTVGFIGDGINDAPAIKAADAGLSVEGATDVARAAADLILLAPDLGVLADGVEEGRRTYANITKYVRMGTSSNFGNMLSMALASLVIPFLPLTAVQILLNNLLYDLSETGIPFDAVDPEDTAAPHAWNMHAVLRFTLVMGPVSSIFDIATFTLLLELFRATPELFRTAWFVESIATQVLVIFLIRTARPFWASKPHRVLVVTSLSALGLALFTALGPFAGLLGFAPLPASLLLAIGGLVIAYLLCAEGAKRFAIVSG